MRPDSAKGESQMRGSGNWLGWAARQMSGNAMWDAMKQVWPYGGMLLLLITPSTGWAAWLAGFKWWQILATGLVSFLIVGLLFLAVVFALVRRFAGPTRLDHNVVASNIAAADRNLPRADAAELTARYIRGRRISVVDLTTPTAFQIENKIFEECDMYGPGVLFMNNCEIG